MASDIVASALRYNTVYNATINSNNCNWIADNVVAGAGAVMPFENASNDPADNQEGGFWRIVDATYWTGTDPGSITIDRLDPNQQYLITGTTLTEHRAAARPGERCRSARAALAASSPRRSRRRLTR
jgi:hypothetical protein